MESKFKMLVRSLFDAYINNKRLTCSLDTEEYEYLLYHKLDMAFYGISGGINNHKMKENFQNKREMIAKKNNSYQVEIDKILLEFNKNGINYVLLKGWACLIELYHAFTDRYFGDTDILVEERDISKVEKILLDIGYKYGYIEQGVIVEPRRDEILFQRYRMTNRTCHCCSAAVRKTPFPASEK